MRSKYSSKRILKGGASVADTAIDISHSIPYEDYGKRTDLQPYTSKLMPRKANKYPNWAEIIHGNKDNQGIFMSTELMRDFAKLGYIDYYFRYICNIKKVIPIFGDFGVNDLKNMFFNVQNKRVYKRMMKMLQQNAEVIFDQVEYILTSIESGDLNMKVIIKSLVIYPRDKRIYSESELLAIAFFKKFDYDLEDSQVVDTTDYSSFFLKYRELMITILKTIPSQKFRKYEDLLTLNPMLLELGISFYYTKTQLEKIQSNQLLDLAVFSKKGIDERILYHFDKVNFLFGYHIYSIVELFVEHQKEIKLNNKFLVSWLANMVFINKPFIFIPGIAGKADKEKFQASIDTLTQFQNLAKVITELNSADYKTTIDLTGILVDPGTKPPTPPAPPKPQPVKPPPPPPHLSPTVSDGISGDLSVKEKIRILKKHIKESIPKILPENPILHEVTFYSETSKYIYDVFRSWFLESKKGQEWLLKKRKELKSIKNEDSYFLTIDLLTDNVTLKQNNIQNSDDGNIISNPVFPGFDGPNTININIHTHPYNQGLHYLKFKTQEKLSYPRLLSMPSNIDIISDFETALLYYHFAAIIAPNDISFYSWHHDLIMEAVNNQSNPDKQKLLLDVLAHNANEIKSDLVKEEYQKLSIDELIIRLKKRYLNLLDHENDAPIKAIKYEIIKLEALSIQEAAPPTPPTTKPSPEEQAIIDSFTPSKRAVYESFLNGCLLKFNVADAIIMAQKL